jgi:hypothetical protein
VMTPHLGLVHSALLLVIKGTSRAQVGIAVTNSRTPAHFNGACPPPVRRQGASGLLGLNRPVTNSAVQVELLIAEFFLIRMPYNQRHWAQGSIGQTSHEHRAFGRQFHNCNRCLEFSLSNKWDGHRFKPHSHRKGCGHVVSGPAGTSRQQCSSARRFVVHC